MHTRSQRTQLTRGSIDNSGSLKAYKRLHSLHNNDAPNVHEARSVAGRLRGPINKGQAVSFSTAIIEGDNFLTKYIFQCERPLWILGPTLRRMYDKILQGSIVYPTRATLAYRLWMAGDDVRDNAIGREGVRVVDMGSWFYSHSMTDLDTSTTLYNVWVENADALLQLFKNFIHDRQQLFELYMTDRDDAQLMWNDDKLDDTWFRPLRDVSIQFMETTYVSETYGGKDQYLARQIVRKLDAPFGDCVLEAII